jgi:hypothetical protein
MVEGDRSEAPHQQIDAENIKPTDDLSAVDKLIHWINDRSKYHLAMSFITSQLHHPP